MQPLNLSKIKFTDEADKVYSETGIYNPKYSYVKTLKGDDEIVGEQSISDDFALSAFVGVAAENVSAITSVDLSFHTNIYVNGIRNKGIISTNQGRDIIRGIATAKIAAIAQTVSEAIAYVDPLDTSVITQTFANIDINAIANGINNSGYIGTGSGSDTIVGEVKASVAAVTRAIADATAIVNTIAHAPVSDGLTAFAGAIAQSLAKATVIATGIKNVKGIIYTGKGNDNISASATSYSATYAEASAFAFAAATPENEALALTVVEAIAKTEDKAIAINNTDGYIYLGRGADTITATAKASDTAIAINNTDGKILAGSGKDIIIANAKGNESDGIFGGHIYMGRGDDRLEASSFGGGVNINMGDGEDFVQGFGDATINGGEHFDILNLGSYKIEDFHIRHIRLDDDDDDDNDDDYDNHNNKVIFEYDDMIMTTTNFEQFNFDDGSLTLNYDQLYQFSNPDFGYIQAD